MAKKHDELFNEIKAFERHALYGNKTKFLRAISQELPSDYEPCGECNFDHSYEYEEAHKWHKEHSELESAEKDLKELMHDLNPKE
jgi:uncharacterized membrane protein YgaE (UPF0421/DUF939 family)